MVDQKQILLCILFISAVLPMAATYIRPSETVLLATAAKVESDGCHRRNEEWKNAETRDVVAEGEKSTFVEGT